MASLIDIFNEVARSGPFDAVRRKYLKELHELTDRNVVAYYSAFLQKPQPDLVALTAINDDDKNGFMACFHKLHRAKGLDLILHSPGGDVAATESIIDYLRSMFSDNIRVIVPQISMSGGTVIALAGKQIVMARHSNLGPIDPQFGNWPAAAILAEFERAKKEVHDDPTRALLWQAIIQHYPPTLLSKADRAIRWTRQIATRTLLDGMLKNDAQRDKAAAEGKADDIVKFLMNQDEHHAHNRHIHRDDLRKQGLEIEDLERQQRFQDGVMSVHHAFMTTLANTPAVKIIENHAEVALIRHVVLQNIPVQPRPPVSPPAPPAPQPQPQPMAPQPTVPHPARPQVLQQLRWFDRLKLAFRVLRGR